MVRRVFFIFHKVIIKKKLFIRGDETRDGGVGKRIIIIVEERKEKKR